MFDFFKAVNIMWTNISMFYNYSVILKLLKLSEIRRENWICLDLIRLRCYFWNNFTCLWKFKLYHILLNFRKFYLIVFLPYFVVRMTWICDVTFWEKSTTEPFFQHMNHWRTRLWCLKTTANKEKLNYGRVYNFNQK